MADTVKVEIEFVNLTTGVPVVETVEVEEEPTLEFINLGGD